MADWIMKTFELHPITSAWVAALLISIFGIVCNLLARGIWVGFEVWFYSGWIIEVKHGKSGRHWHAPLDTKFIKALFWHDYVTVKQLLGTMLSGDGHLEFSLGVTIGEPARKRRPTAPGLSFDDARRRVLIDFAAARPMPIVPAPPPAVEDRPASSPPEAGVAPGLPAAG